jgi:hypothetical protein
MSTPVDIPILYDFPRLLAKSLSLLNETLPQAVTLTFPDGEREACGVEIFIPLSGIDDDVGPEEEQLLNALKSHNLNIDNNCPFLIERTYWRRGLARRSAIRIQLGADHLWTPTSYTEEIVCDIHDLWRI